MCGALSPAVIGQARPSAPALSDVRLVTDEAEAVLAILDKRKTGQPISETDWQRLFSSEGYVRLKNRETSMRRSFEDSDFKTFILSAELAARAQSLTETLDRWRRADTSGAARLALAYLPKEARLRAKIYPVIKPRENSFVFDVKSDPAIFLYLDPAVTKEQFENTLAHELHHIGFGSGCPTARMSEEIARSPQNVRSAITWLGAFGEGFAMLAAAGGPDKHPHAASKQEDRARWEKDLSNFNDDLKKLEKFFLEVLENRLTGDDIQRTAATFYGTQGPWYTVGWKMSVVIEKTFGREKLIECMCDQRKLLPTYNEAVARYHRRTRERLASWSEILTDAFASPGPRTKKGRR